jgi:hypothetical protein
LALREILGWLSVNLNDYRLKPAERQPAAEVTWKLPTETWLDFGSSHPINRNFSRYFLLKLSLCRFNANFYR